MAGKRQAAEPKVKIQGHCGAKYHQMLTEICEERRWTAPVAIEECIKHYHDTYIKPLRGSGEG